MRKIVLFIFALASMCVGAELDAIKKSGEIRIGVRTALYPFSKQNPDGSFEGFEVELAKRIGKDIVGAQGKVTLVGVSAKERMEFLRDGRIDIAVASFAKTPEREKFVDFSIPYFSMTDAILTHKSKRITSLSQAYGNKILAVPGTTSYEYIKNSKQFILIDCANSNDCFTRLKAGEADYYSQMVQMIGAFPLVEPDYVISLKKIGPDYFLSVGLPKDCPKLREFIDNEILALSKAGFFKQAYKDIFDPFYRGTLDKRFFLLDSIYDMLH